MEEQTGRFLREIRPQFLNERSFGAISDQPRHLLTTFEDDHRGDVHNPIMRRQCGLFLHVDLNDFELPFQIDGNFLQRGT